MLPLFSNLVLAEMVRAETAWGVSCNNEWKMEDGFDLWPLTVTGPVVLSLEAGDGLHWGTGSHCTEENGKKRKEWDSL